MTIFSEQLKKLRQEKHLSQENLAEQLFISRQAISKWENGDTTPDLDNLIKISEILGASLDELVLGKSPEKIVERVIEKEKNMTFLEFIVDYWWLLFPLGGFLVWFLHAILPGIFG